MRHQFLEGTGRVDRHRHPERRTVLLAAVERHLGDTVAVIGAAAGLHSLLQLENWSSRDTENFVTAAATRHIGILPATPFYAKPPPTLRVLLAFGGIEAARIEPGIRALARVIHEAVRRKPMR